MQWESFSISPRVREVPPLGTSFTGLPSTNDVTTRCCARCTDVCFGRLQSTWPANLSGNHTSTHLPEEQTSYTSPTPIQTSSDCPSSIRVLTTTTSCHKMSDQSKAYHPSSMHYWPYNLPLNTISLKYSNYYYLMHALCVPLFPGPAWKPTLMDAAFLLSNNY